MQMLSSVLWFVAILALIPLALWLLKRSPAGARFGGTAPAGLMRSVAALPLAAGQRVVTIEVGLGADRTWLVLGVTAQSITTLHRMAPQGDAPMAAPVSVPTFAQLFGKLRPGSAAPRSDVHE